MTIFFFFDTLYPPPAAAAAAAGGATAFAASSASFFAASSDTLFAATRVLIVLFKSTNWDLVASTTDGRASELLILWHRLFAFSFSRFVAFPQSILSLAQLRSGCLKIEANPLTPVTTPFPKPWIPPKTSPTNTAAPLAAVPTTSPAPLTASPSPFAPVFIIVAPAPRTSTAAPTPLTPAVAASPAASTTFVAVFTTAVAAFASFAPPVWFSLLKSLWFFIIFNI